MKTHRKHYFIIKEKNLSSAEIIFSKGPLEWFLKKDIFIFSSKVFFDFFKIYLCTYLCVNLNYIFMYIFICKFKF